MPFGIEGAVESAVKSVLSFIAEQLYAMMNMLISDLLVPLITSSPMPRSDANMPMLKYPFEPGSGRCGDLYNGAKLAECNMWSELYHNVYMQDVMYIAVVLFVISFAVTWTARSFGVFGDKALQGDGMRNSGDYIDRFVYAFLGILLWWPIGTGVLFFSNIFTDILVGCTGASCEVFTSITPSSAVGGAAIAALVLYTVGNIAMLGVVLFWVARYLILVVFMAIMPIMFSLWTLSVGPLDSISDTASEFMDFFLLLAFAPIPAGLILMMGDAIGMIADSFPGAGQFIVESIVFVTFPLLAGVVPIILFQQESNLSQAGMVGAAMDNQLGKVTSDSLSDYYGSGQNLGIEEDYGRARKGASGAYAAYNQGNAVEWDDEEGAWVEADDPAASSNIMNRVGLGARKTETAGMFAHDMARSEGARQAVKENLSDAHEDIKKTGGYSGFLANQAKQRSKTVSAFDSASQFAVGATKQATNITAVDDEMAYDTWRSGEEVHEAMSDFEARARREKRATPDGDVMIEQRAEDGSNVSFSNLNDVWQLQQSGRQLAQDSDDLDDVVGYSSRTKIDRDVLDEKFDEDELEDTEEVANAIRNGSPGEIVEAVNGQVLEENKITEEEARELRDESTIRMSRSVTEQAVDDSISADLDDTSKVAEAIAYGDEKDVRKAVNTQVEEHEEISQSEAETLILAAEDAASRSGLDEQSAEDYEELREFMAAMQNTDATEVDDPALRRALQEFEDTEAASQYASQFTDGLDANDVTDILGGDDLDDDTAQKLAEDAQDSVETVYTTMLQEMVEGIDDSGDIPDDADMEDVVTDNLGAEYVEKAQEMVNETTLENTDLFSLVGGQTEEQMAQAVEKQFEGYTNAVVEEVTEALHTGDAESAFEALAREEAEQDDIEWNMRSMFDMDEDEIQNLDTQGIAEAMAEGQNEMFKEMRKQMADKSVEEVKEMQSQLMEETVETVADDLEKANKEVAEFIEENSNEFTPDEIMEQVEEMNADILEGKDDTAHEEVSETIQNLEDTKYSSLAQDTLAMLSQLDSNEVDNPDLKTALTQFESKQQDIPADYFEGRDISEEDVADQLRELSDAETERLANAASGDDYNLDGVFKMMNVAYNGNTRWEDQTADEE